jgi:hypothetical protein
MSVEILQVNMRVGNRAQSLQGLYTVPSILDPLMGHISGSLRV